MNNLFFFFYKILIIFQLYFSTGTVGSTSVGEPVPCIQELSPDDFIDQICYRLKSVLKVRLKKLKKNNIYHIYQDDFDLKMKELMKNMETEMQGMVEYNNKVIQKNA